MKAGIRKAQVNKKYLAEACEEKKKGIWKKADEKKRKGTRCMCQNIIE